MKLSPAKFKALQAEWDKKLADSGFEDIERREDDNLKRYHSMDFFNHGNRHPDRQNGKEEYYRLAGQFLYEHKFANEDQHALWKMHCEGKTVSGYRSKNVGCARTAYNIVERLAKIMASKWKG